MLSREFRILKSESVAAAPAPAEKSVDDEGVVHELSNIRVHEVSLVDRPANRRGFLVKKNDKKKPEPADTAVASEVLEVDDIVDIAPPNEGGTPRRKSKEKPPEVTAAAADTPAKKDDPPGDDKTPTDRPAGDPPAADPAPTNAPAPVVDPAPTSPAPDDKTTEVKVDVEVSGEGVEKVGKPMARKRLDKLKGALKTLTDILGEVDLDGEASAKGETPAADPAPAPPAAAFVELAELPLVKELRTTVEGLQKSLIEQTKVVEALQKMVATQGEQLRKSSAPADSNQISVEKVENGHDKVVWPADMSYSNSSRPGGASHKPW